MYQIFLKSLVREGLTLLDPMLSDISGPGMWRQRFELLEKIVGTQKSFETQGFWED